MSKHRKVPLPPPPRPRRPHTPRPYRPTKALQESLWRAEWRAREAKWKATVETLKAHQAAQDATENSDVESPAPDSNPRDMKNS
jgi:hypothetical protein